MKEHTSSQSDSQKAPNNKSPTATSTLSYWSTLLKYILHLSMCMICFFLLLHHFISEGNILLFGSLQIIWQLQLLVSLD